MVNKVLATQAFPTELCSQNPQKKTKQSLGVTRVRELTLLLTSYSTWERRPCNLPGQLTRTEPVVRVSGEPALSKTTGELTANGKEGPAPCLGQTVELALVI